MATASKTPHFVTPRALPDPLRGCVVAGDRSRSAALVATASTTPKTVVAGDRPRLAALVATASTTPKTVVAGDRPRLAVAAFLGLLSLFVAPPGFVRSAAAEPSWLELAGGVRWDDLTPDRKDRALKNYREYKSLSPEDRGRVDEGYRRWKGMSDDDKARLRDRYERKRKKRD